MPSQSFASDIGWSDRSGVTRTGEFSAASAAGNRMCRLSFEVLRDLGITNAAIGAYLARFGDARCIATAVQGNHASDLSDEAGAEIVVLFGARGMSALDTMPRGATSGTLGRLLSHHLTQLKLPTVLRENDRLAPRVQNERGLFVQIKKPDGGSVVRDVVSI